jgi:hypothetical protein
MQLSQAELLLRTLQQLGKIVQYSFIGCSNVSYHPPLYFRMRVISTLSYARNASSQGATELAYVASIDP